MPGDDPDEQVLRPLDQLERRLLYLLTRPDDTQPLWSLDEIGHELESDEPILPVRGLNRAGLLHKTADGYVFATRPALRLMQLLGHPS